MTYTYHRIMNADYNKTEDVSLEHICDWTSYCTHHNNMDVPWGTSICTRWCTFRIPLSVNVLLHTSQENGRSPVCTCWCNFRCSSCVNVLWHTSQQYEHSLVCKPSDCCPTEHFTTLIAVVLTFHSMHSWVLFHSNLLPKCSIKSPLLKRRKEVLLLL